jgi:hypothetical protein
VGVMSDTYIDRGHITEANVDFKYEPSKEHYDFIPDGQWHTFDLEDKVPANAKRVRLGIIINAPQTNTCIEVSEFPIPGFNVGWARVSEPGVADQNNEEICFPPDSKVLGYWIHNKPVNFIFVYVLGWWI